MNIDYRVVVRKFDDYFDLISQMNEDVVVIDNEVSIIEGDRIIK